MLLAQEINNPVLKGSSLSNIGGDEFIILMVQKAIGFSFVFGTVFFLFVMLMGAIQWIMSNGDKGAVESARSKITNAIIGLIILFCVYAVLALVQQFFGLELFNLNLGALKLG